MASYIFINSNDRNYASSTTPSQFNIQINSTFADSPRSALSVENITLYNLEYGVNSTNNTITFRENSDNVTDFTITITPGNYSSSDFISALKTAMEAVAANTYTITYSSITGKLNITTLLPDTFKLVSGTMLNTVMGFEVMTSFLATKTADYPINLAGTSYIDVSLGLQNRNIVSGFNQVRPFVRIPMNVGFGSLIDFTNYSSDDESIIATDDIDEFNITLYNDRKQILDLPRNCVVSVVLKVKSIF